MKLITSFLALLSFTSVIANDNLNATELAELIQPVLDYYAHSYNMSM